MQAPPPEELRQELFAHAQHQLTPRTRNPRIGQELKPSVRLAWYGMC